MKTVDTNLNFTTDTTTNTETTTTSTGCCYTSFWCKYLLPCGKCDKTGEQCGHYAVQPQPVYPYYPYYPYRDWWNWGPTWTSTDYTVTCTAGNKTEK